MSSTYWSIVLGFWIYSRSHEALHRELSRTFRRKRVYCISMKQEPFFIIELPVCLEVVLMRASLRIILSFQAAHRILVDAPDVICLQEGLEGMDILSQAGSWSLMSLCPDIIVMKTKLVMAMSTRIVRLATNGLHLRFFVLKPCETQLGAQLLRFCKPKYHSVNLDSRIGRLHQS